MCSENGLFVFNLGCDPSFVQSTVLLLQVTVWTILWSPLFGGNEGPWQIWTHMVLGVPNSQPERLTHAPASAVIVGRVEGLPVWTECLSNRQA
jgi:hypothetical protein